MRRSDPRRPRMRHARPMAGWKRALVVVGVSLALIAVSTGSAAALYVYRLNNNIHQVDIVDALGTDRPANKPTVKTADVKHDPVDILIMGSDTRAGKNGIVGGDEVDGRSDTTILLHLSGDGKAAYGISIPRDTMVQIPDCLDAKDRNYHTGTAPHKFNEAYTIGGDKNGAACTVKTVESITGVRIEHYVVVDFFGFNAMVNALGGVEVCVPEGVDDDRYHIHLRAGRNTIKGKEALDYVRARHGLGDGSDLGRTERQQYFISAMIRKALKQGLTRPDRLLRFLDAATQSLTTDMRIKTLQSLARQVQGIGLGNIVFTTIPTVPDPNNPKVTLVFSSQAGAVWQALIDDTELPGQKKRRSTSASPTPTASPLPVVRTAPNAVRVRVVDGTGSPERAQAAAADLRERGFQVVEVREGRDATVTQTTVRYDPAYDESARTLSASVPGSVDEAAPELSRTLELVVGSDYSGTTKVRVSTPKPTPEVSASPLVVRNALSDGCKTTSTAAPSPSPTTDSTGSPSPSPTPSEPAVEN